MTKEIIVNAAETESRVAILENGRLMELHIEREQKIVGNIYKGRVTKVLRGMDAAFVDIGIELNAFLSASDVVAQEGDEEEGNGHGNGRIGRGPIPPITQLLHGNQEILVQVVRAPMGTKGARVTTRLSLPGRYMVLMLNSGTYVGVSRKIEDPKERLRLRTIAGKIRPANYSLIVRTEAEGKSEEELRQDLAFLVDMAQRIEGKASHSPAPSLVHGDMSLVLRLIRDAFTRDINRLVLDSPSAYENALELVGMLSPHLKNRVYLYDEALPIFHAYNIEPEIERTLRRKVWLPSGGYLIVDQAEALIAIDVNTGRFVGSVELAETVLTTNLQAADEVARQLRLRDLGGIIVVDFIDMDNPKHRAQVMKVFEEALRRDRAKIKVHNISPLGLVEMTRKRTGESLAGLLTEPCPYCSGIGRVQNALTMALRVQRELATAAVEHPRTEAFLVVAHPRVVAHMLGYEGEVHHDLEQYLGRPVYIRSEEDYHPNTYRIEHLTLEQALIAVPHIEESEVQEGQVVNPDPEVSLEPLVNVKGIYVVVPGLDAPVGAHVKVRITRAGTSMATAEPMAAEQRGVRTEAITPPLASPPLVPVSVLPPYLREERATLPPRELPLLSPSAEAVPTPVREEELIPSTLETLIERRRGKNRRRRGQEYGREVAEVVELQPVEQVEEIAPLPVEAVEEVAAPEAPGVSESPASRRRRRRRRGRGGAAQQPETVGEIAGENVLDVPPIDQLPELEEEAEIIVMESPAVAESNIFAMMAEEAASEAASMEAVAELLAEVLPPAEPAAEEVVETGERTGRRRRRSRRRRGAAAHEEILPVGDEAPQVEETAALETAELEQLLPVEEGAEPVEETPVTEIAPEEVPVTEEPNVEALLLLEEPRRDEEITPETFISMMNAIPEPEAEEAVPAAEAVVEEEIAAEAVTTEVTPEEAPAAAEVVEEPQPAPARRRRAPRKKKAAVVDEQQPEIPPMLPVEVPAATPPETIPAEQPEVLPIPEPSVVPNEEPETVPEITPPPAPEPETVPLPAPETPEPTPETTPTPEPETAPTPAPEIGPEPKPAAVPEVEPRPEPPTPAAEPEAEAKPKRRRAATTRRRSRTATMEAEAPTTVEENAPPAEETEG